MRRCLCMQVLLVGVGCSEPRTVTVEEEPQFGGELCGEGTPRRILELDDSMRRHLGPDDTLRAGDRWLFVVRSELEFLDPEHPQPFEYRVFSVDECGNDLREPAPGVYNLLADSTEELLLGCQGENGLVGIDPLAERSPWPIFERGASCSSTQTPHGLVGLVLDADDTLWIAINRTPEIPGSPTELLRPGFTTGSATADGRLLFSEGTTLMTLDLETTEEASLFEGVREYRRSAHGRWMLWSEDVEFGDPCNNIPMHLYDFESGSDTVVGHGCVLSHPGQAADILSYNTYEPTQTVHLVLGTEKQIALPPDDHLVARTSSDHLILQRPRNDGTRDVVSVDSSTGEETLLFEDGSVARVLPDAIEVFGSVVDGAAPVWRVPLDGSGPTLLLRRTQSYYAPLGGHLIWTSDADVTGTGMLFAVVPEDLVEKLVDTGVRSRTEIMRENGDAEAVLYNVEDGTRSGVYVLGAQ